ncbi:MAG: hypothetical protein J6S89_01790 [Paludibacteraceae bacterium]|nr:hypothetical protein [Paludibacteraceae bacterium]
MKRLSITLSIIGLTSISFAQEGTQATGKQDTTILKNIEVVKEYNPVIKESGKISTMPELKDIKTEKKNSDISVWTVPYPIKPGETQTLDFASVEPEKRKFAKERHAKLGFGNYASFYGDFYTPLFKNDKNLLDFSATHNSTFGKVKLTPKLYEELPSELASQATFNDTEGKLSYTHKFKRMKLSTFVWGNYTLLKRYGYDDEKLDLANSGVKETDNDSLKQSYFRLCSNIRFSNYKYSSSKWDYDCEANYRLLKTRDELSEHTIHTILRGSYHFDKSSFNLTYDMHNIIMNLPENNEIFTFENRETLNNYTMIKLIPSYRFKVDLGEINVGVKGTFCINQGKKGAVTPDVYGKVRLINNILYVYAGVTGDYTMNNYQRITKENPYISTDTRVEDTYMPIDAYVGLSAKIAKRVNMDIHAGYKLIENPYFFVNRYDTLTDRIRNTFDVVYDEKAGMFNAGIRLDYQFESRFNATFIGEFNKWALSNIEEAWHKPKWKMNVQTSYMATEFLKLRLGYLLETGKRALVKTSNVALPNSHDLFVGAEFSLFDWLSFYVNFDNVISQEYESWYGYTCHRFNVMGGASIIF